MRRNRVLLLLLAVVLLAGAADTARASVPVALPLRRSFPLPAASFAPPALAGTAVAYAFTSCRGCGPSLSLGNISTGRSRLVARLGSDISLLDLWLSPRWLVWLEASSPRLGWKLWAWNRATGRRRLVDSSATEGGPAAPGIPEISLRSDTLAWVRHDCVQRCSRPGPSTLRLLDLRGGTARVVSHVSYVCRQIGFPALSDTVLSWVGVPLSGYGCPAPNTWTVVTRDRRTGRLSFHEIHLSRNQMAGEFTGQGQWEAWVEGLEYTNRDQRVMLMNLQTGAPRTVTRHGAYSPRLSGHTLAWMGAFGSQVWAMDLRSGKRYLLDHETSSATLDTGPGTWLGCASQNRVVWEDDSFNPNGGAIHRSVVVATVP